MVLSGARYAVSSFFIHNSTQIHYAARVAGLNFFTQLINIIILDPFVCCSRKPFLTEGLIRLDADQKLRAIVHLNWTSKHEKQQLSLLQRRSPLTSCDPIDAGRPAPQTPSLANPLSSTSLVEPPNRAQERCVCTMVQSGD